MGKPRDPAYWRKWRAAHPAYRDRERDRLRRRDRTDRGDRSAEYAKRNAARASRAAAPLGELFPDLVRGSSLLFVEEDLARDVRQERALAELEGRDPEHAEKAYRSRERRERHLPLAAWR